MRPVHDRPEQKAQKLSDSVRRRRSPWPPVWLSGWPAMNRARAFEQALLDRGLDAVVGAAGVAQRGEAAMQHGAHGDRAFRGEQRQRHVGQQAQVHLGQHDMDVRVDQPRHQRAAAEVDARGGGAGNGSVGDLLHRAVLDQDRDAVLKLVVARIEESTAAEQIAGHDLRPFLTKSQP